MKRYRGYAQNEYNAEKFDVAHEDGTPVVVVAENETDAVEKFREWTLENCMYTEEEIEGWLEENQLHAVEV